MNKDFLFGLFISLFFAELITLFLALVLNRQWGISFKDIFGNTVYLINLGIMLVSGVLAIYFYKNKEVGE